MYGARFRPLNKNFFVFTHIRVNCKYVLEVTRACVNFTYVRIPTYKQMRETVSLYVNILSMYLKFHVGTHRFKYT